MAYLIINDTHLDLSRNLGTTPASVKAFKAYQFSALRETIRRHGDLAVIVLGDLLNAGLISLEAIRETCTILREITGTLYLVAGNHDLTKDRERMSAFDLLCWMLPGAVVVKEPMELEPGCTIIPHLPNQEMFDAAVMQAYAAGTTTLLAHCNYDNFFATEKDHSLNLSAEQAALFDHVILGHEHNKRDLEGVDILGSMLPCGIKEASVNKGFHLWQGPGHEVEFQLVWDTEACAAVDWQELDHIGPDIDFVRVVGEATAEQAATVINTIAKFRAATNYYMITNSVRVGELNLGSLTDNSETDLVTFDPMALLMEALSPDHRAKVEAFQKCA